MFRMKDMFRVVPYLHHRMRRSTSARGSAAFWAVALVEVGDLVGAVVVVEDLVGAAASVVMAVAVAAVAEETAAVGEMAAVGVWAVAVAWPAAAARTRGTRRTCTTAARHCNAGADTSFGTARRRCPFDAQAAHSRTQPLCLVAETPSASSAVSLVQLDHCAAAAPTIAWRARRGTISRTSPCPCAHASV